MDRQSLILAIEAKIESVKDAILEQWNNPIGTNTKHFIVDNLLPDEVCQEIYDAFPKDGKGFICRESFREKKRTSAQLVAQNSVLREITFALQDPAIVNKIASLVELTDIIPDSSLYAGGLSMMFKGDFLNPHIDNSHDADRKHFRRLNILYYVTPSWQLENGGNFELWDDAQKVPKTIVSAFNRLVVMNTNRTSWHSVSPVKVDNIRCCVSNYYFSVHSPEEESDYFHVTSFTGRPEEPVKRVLGVVDNVLRNTISKTFKIGRGKELVNDVD